MAKKRKRTKPASRRSAGHRAATHGASGAGAARPASGGRRLARFVVALRGSHPLDPWLIALALAGIALTAYLTLVAWLGERPAYCGPDSGCDLVQSSRWSTLLGMPIALWGLGAYAVLARVLWRLRERPSKWRLAFAIAAIAAGVSWYLTLISAIELEATCAWCLASFTVANLLLLLLVLRRPAHLQQHAWSRALPAPLAAAGAVVLVLHLHFSGVFSAAAGPEDPYLRELAIHLSDSGARFYGAYWCPHCQEQKALFGASADRLPYVECTPNGRNGPTEVRCLTAKVNDYPTWTIGERRVGGVIEPDALARMSGFRRDAQR